ncbi:MAG: hypothetical protein L0211_11105, partial [Planctomycetaceae bacterium]|nr:hypothetical protein [Planctomycetaceae bacterium]
AAAAASSIDGNPTAKRIKEALAKLAKETAEERLKKINEEEAEALREPSADEGLQAAITQGVRLLTRAKKVFGRVGPPAGKVIDAIETALAEAGLVSV